jgi:hypothetical protein
MPGLFWILTKLGVSGRAASIGSWVLAIAIAVAVVAVLWARGEGYRADAADAKQQASAQIEEYREAYLDAFKIAWGKKIAAEKRDQQAKEKADEAYIEELEGGLARANAYAAGNRCVRIENRADPGSAGGTGMPGPTAAPPKPDRATGTAELVGITRRDFDLCAAAGLRLRNAHAWAQDYPTAAEGRATD